MNSAKRGNRNGSEAQSALSETNPLDLDALKTLAIEKITALISCKFKIEPDPDPEKGIDADWITFEACI
jgi:hypothetical protein